MTPNDKRFRIIDGIVKDYKIDAVIELTWLGCHTYNIEANLVIKHVTKNCKIPYLQIETDYSEGDAGQISTRVQALLELL